MLTTASWLQQRWQATHNSRDHPPTGAHETVRALAARLAAAPASNPQLVTTNADVGEGDAAAAEQATDIATTEVRTSLRSLKTIARDRPSIVAAEAWAALLEALAALVSPPPPLPPIPAFAPGHTSNFSQQGDDLARQRTLQRGRMRQARRAARERARAESLTALVDTLTALCDEPPYTDQPSSDEEKVKEQRPDSSARAQSFLVDPAHLARLLSLLGSGVHVPPHRPSDTPPESDVPSPDYPYPPALSLACLRLLRTLVRAAPERAGAVLLGIQGGMAVILRWISPEEAQYEPDLDDEPEGVMAHAALRAEALLVLPSLVAHSAPLAQLALYEGALDALLAWLVARAQARGAHELPVDADIDALEACEALLARAPGANKYFAQAQLGYLLSEVVGFAPARTPQDQNRPATRPKEESQDYGQTFDLAAWNQSRGRISQAAIHVLSVLLNPSNDSLTAVEPTQDSHHDETLEAPPFDYTTQVHLTHSHIVQWLTHVLLASHAPTTLRTNAARVLGHAIKGCLEAQTAVFECRIALASNSTPPTWESATTALVRLLLDCGLLTSAAEDGRSYRALYISAWDVLGALVYGNPSARRALILSSLDVPAPAVNLDSDADPAQYLLDPAMMDTHLLILSRPNDLVRSTWAACSDVTKGGALADVRGARAAHFLAFLLVGSGDIKDVLALTKVPLPTDRQDDSAPVSRSEVVSESETDSSEPVAAAPGVPLLDWLAQILDRVDPHHWTRTHVGILVLLAQWTWDWDAQGQGLLSYVSDAQAFLHAVGKPLQKLPGTPDGWEASGTAALLASVSALTLSTMALFQPATPDAATHLACITSLVPGPGEQNEGTWDSTALIRLVQVATALRHHPAFAHVRPLSSRQAGSLPAPTPLPSDLVLPTTEEGSLAAWIHEWFDWSFVLWWHGAICKVHVGSLRADLSRSTPPLAQPTPTPSHLTKLHTKMQDSRTQVQQALTQAQRARAEHQAADQHLAQLEKSNQQALHQRALGAAAAATDIRTLRDELAQLPLAPRPGTAAAQEQDADEAEESSENDTVPPESDVESSTPDPALLDRIVQLQATLGQAIGQLSKHHSTVQDQAVPDHRQRNPSELQQVQTENEDLLVLLEELATKRAQEKVLLRTYGVEVSEDEDDENAPGDDA